MPENEQDGMSTEERLVRFVVRANWLILLVCCAVSLWAAPMPFTIGVLAGGLIACGNFHLLARTLKNAFRPGELQNYHAIIAKYYLRFFASGLIIFVLIAGKFVDPLGLFIGLSVVVLSIITALVAELKHHIG
ncbi:MAG: ATP synthase subunit I [Desulfatibacillaceae bacterium]